MNNKEILCGLSLAEFPSRKLILISLSFHYYHCFLNSVVDCTKEAAVHQNGGKNARQRFFNIARWSHFFCHGSVNCTAKQGVDGFLICCLSSLAVWKHDNRSSGHTNCTNLNVYIRTLMYFYESYWIYTNLDVYIRISIYIYESWCIYTNLNVYIRILMYISLSWYINLWSCCFVPF